MIDLHLHLDGSLSLNSVRHLAQLQGESLPEDDTEILRHLQVGKCCLDLGEYLAKFDFPLSFLQTEEQLSYAAFCLKEELRENGILYAEIRFAPQSHCRRGLTQEEAVLAVLNGCRQSPLPGGVILCCMRGDHNEKANLETVRLTEKYLNHGVCAVDLAGAEAIFPTESYRHLFFFASSLGVPFTIHAGEADGPDSVRSALAFGAKRIGHGVRAGEDPSLLRELAESGICLELCPTSNLHTGLFSSYSEFPLQKFLDAGVPVTINSDNMAVSHTDVLEEYRHMQQTFSLPDEAIRQLQRNAVAAAFADNATKQFLYHQI